MGSHVGLAVSQRVPPPTPAGVVPLNEDLYKKYFSQDTAKLTIFDYNAKGMVPKVGDEKASSKDTTTTADKGGSPGDRSGSEAVLEELIRRREKLKAYFQADERNRAKVTCPTFPFCNHIPPPPPILPPPIDLEEYDAGIEYPWGRQYKDLLQKAQSRSIRNGNLNTPLGPNKGQLEPHWAAAFTRADSETGKSAGMPYHSGMYAPALGKIFETSKGPNKKNLETIQHKWNIVNELPVYAGIDPKTQVNYGDWERSGAAPSKIEQRSGASIKSVGEFYKSKDPSLRGFPGERAGGLAVGDQPEPPAMAGAYIPPPMFDPTWKSASESEEYLPYGANYIRERRR